MVFNHYDHHRVLHHHHHPPRRRLVFPSPVHAVLVLGTLMLIYQGSILRVWNEKSTEMLESSTREEHITPTARPTAPPQEKLLPAPTVKEAPQPQYSLSERNDYYHSTVPPNRTTVQIENIFQKARQRPPTYKPHATQLCKYDGHCPVGMTCAASSNSPLGGECHPYMKTIKSPNSLNQACVDVCLGELKWDEFFHYASSPLQNYTPSIAASSSGRPDGCVVEYPRVLRGTKWPAFSLGLRKRATRHKRVIRVDPVEHTNGTRWRAFCYNPCEANSDCVHEEAFECIEGVCQRRTQYWNRTNDPNYRDMVVVTGASFDYFRGLTNFAASLEHWGPNYKLVVYNLGMSEKQLAKVETWPQVVAIKWKEGFPTHYPPHVSHGKVYAWKPLAINESVHEYGNIFWLDAGATWTAPLTPIEDIVHRTGIFLVKGQDESMKDHSHPRTYEWFQETEAAFHTRPHYAGGIQGHLYPSRYIDSIVIPNAECALIEACINPGSTGELAWANHRFDQTTLSIVAYQPTVQVPHRTEFLASHRSQLNRDLLQPSKQTIWTSRQACQDYRHAIKRYE